METNNQHSYPSWLVPIDIAQKLKEIGFNGGILSEDLTLVTKTQLSGDLGYCSFNLDDFENGEIPTWEQVFAWFREKGLHSFVRMKDTSRYRIDEFYKEEPSWEYMIYRNPDDIIFYSKEYYEFSTYEKAMESLVEDLIDYYKEYYKKEINGDR